MSDFEPGDILLVRFPFQEDPTILKTRPALLLSVDNGIYTVCRITTKDRSGKNRGEFIHSDTMVGKELGLDFDSFIDLDTIRHLKRSLIIRSIGEYREFNELLSKYGIKL